MNIALTIDGKIVEHYLHPILDAIIEESLELDAVWIAFMEYLDHRFTDWAVHQKLVEMPLTWFDELNYSYLYCEVSASLLQERFVALADHLHPYLVAALQQGAYRQIQGFYGEWDNAPNFTPTIIICFAEWETTQQLPLAL